MIKVTIPVYYTHKTKTFLISDNWFRNAFHYQQNQVKVHVSKIIALQLRKYKHIKISGKYTVEYRYYFKNRNSDLTNVTSRASKFFNDTLQDVGIVKKDNVQYLIQEINTVATLDKLNPRIEAFVREVKNGKT